MSKRKLKKASKHNLRRRPCGCCNWIKADRKYRQSKLNKGLYD